MEEEEITRVVFRKWPNGGILAVVMALVLALLLLPGVSHALTDEEKAFDKKALVGLKGMAVLVEAMAPEASAWA